MNIQNELLTFDEKINNIISNRIKYNKDNHSSNSLIKIKNSKIKYLKNKITTDREKEMKKTKKKIEYFNTKDSAKINCLKYIKNNIDYIRIFIIKILIIINFYNQSKSNKIFFYDSEITLKINAEHNNDYYILGKDFQGINHLKEVYIKGKKQKHTNNTYFLNRGDNIVELIWDDNITNCEYLFYLCDKITEIDLSQFDTSQVTNMRRMFSSCSSLTSLDLSNINTSQVTNMLSIFEECSSLTSLYLSNFNTSKVTDMEKMFSGCSSLISLDLSNFDTTQVSKMVGMFASCSLLTSLNLSNLDTSKVTNMSNMFSYCSNLEYINLNNIEIESSSSINDKIFQDVPENVVICINNTDAKEKIFSKIANLNCSVIDCTNDWKSK